MLHIFHTLDNFNTVSLENLMVTGKSSGKLLIYTYYPFNGINYTDYESYEYPFDLNEGIIKPFNLSNIDELKVWLQDVSQFKINLYNIILHS